jgi:hypothetical protein
MASNRQELKQAGFRLGNAACFGSLGSVLKKLRRWNLSGWLRPWRGIKPNASCRVFDLATRRMGGVDEGE